MILCKALHDAIAELFSIAVLIGEESAFDAEKPTAFLITLHKAVLKAELNMPLDDSMAYYPAQQPGLLLKSNGPFVLPKLGFASGLLA